ncbi:MAG: lamin tail domain-containing protein, partial [Nanoarchaeota archaeon]|nr:lamin tail domain-containing protein [Nanoarchaeota archaeon]
MRNDNRGLVVFFIVSALLFTIYFSLTNSGGVNIVSAEKDVKASADNILITEVYYDTYLSNEPEEYVTVFNRGVGAVNVSGWNITDLEGTATFPSNANTTLFPGDCFFVTGNATAFKEETGRVADFEYAVDSDPGVP